MRGVAQRQPFLGAPFLPGQASPRPVTSGLLGKKRKCSFLRHEFDSWAHLYFLQAALEQCLVTLRRDGAALPGHPRRLPEGHGRDPLHLNSPLQHFFHEAFVWALCDLLSSN